VLTRRLPTCFCDVYLHFLVSFVTGVSCSVILILIFHIVGRYEGQRDMLYNQTFNLDQVSFAAEGIKDAQQTVSIKNLTMLMSQ